GRLDDRRAGGLDASARLRPCAFELDDVGNHESPVRDDNPSGAGSCRTTTRHDGAVLTTEAAGRVPCSTTPPPGASAETATGGTVPSRGREVELVHDRKSRGGEPSTTATRRPTSFTMANLSAAGLSSTSSTGPAPRVETKAGLRTSRRDFG